MARRPKPRVKSKRTSRSGDPARRMLWRQVFVGVGLVLFFAGTITGIWHLTRLPALTIESVSASGGVTIKADEIRALVEQELEGAYYRLIPKRFSYLYPKQAIYEVVNTVPRVKDVVVERSGLTALSVTYDEYVPVALWCGPHGDCVFVDAAGYGFAAAPALSGSTFVRYQAGEQAAVVGETGITPELLAETQQFIAAVATTHNLRLQQVIFDDRDITYRLAGGGEVRTSRTEQFQDSLDNLDAILGSDEFVHLEPGNFEYIDLRFGNKVFVQEELPEVATSTATTSQEE
jgi:cell division septal protein FtsQ